MTQADKHNSRSQQYRLTDAGRRWLAACGPMALRATPRWQCAVERHDLERDGSQLTLAPIQLTDFQCKAQSVKSCHVEVFQVEPMIWKT